MLLGLESANEKHIGRPVQLYEYEYVLLHYSFYGILASQYVCVSQPHIFGLGNFCWFDVCEVI